MVVQVDPQAQVENAQPRLRWNFLASRVGTLSQIRIRKGKQSGTTHRLLHI